MTTTSPNADTPGDGGTEEGHPLYPWERVGPLKGVPRLHGNGSVVVVGGDGWEMST